HVAKAAVIDRAMADRALTELEVDAAGLDAMDRRYLSMIAEHYGGGPVGIETIAAALSEPRDAIEDIIEPFLIQRGFVQRTPRGTRSDAPAWPRRRATRRRSACSVRGGSGADSTGGASRSALTSGARENTHSAFSL